MSNVQLSHVLALLEEKDAKHRWDIYIGWLYGFELFWDEAITNMSQRTHSDQVKLKVYREVIATSFGLMNDWYYGRKPLVKARRNEIDSAISFLRNTALRTEVRDTLGAACARNLAGVLRSAVYLSIHGYPPQDYPFVMSNSFFNLAAVRSLFPADTSDFVQFLKPGENIVRVMKKGQPIEANINNLQVMVERGCKHLGISEAYIRLQEELDYIGDNLSSPKPWHSPADLWREHENSLLSDLHYRARERFASTHM